MRNLPLHWKIFIGLCAGVAAGLAARLFGLESLVTGPAAVIGTLFIKALRMVAVPLIGASLVASVAGLGSEKRFGRLGAKTAVYYVYTTLLAILTGLVLVNILQPGIGADLGFAQQVQELPPAAAGLSDVILGIVPANPVEALARSDILPIIFFALLFGFFIGRSPQGPRERLHRFFQDIFDVMMRITHFIIAFAPLGVGALMAQTTAEHGLDIFLPLGKYMLTVALGLGLHAALTLPLVLILFGALRPLRHLQAVMPALMTAFSSASSSATLPITMEAVRDNDGVSGSVSGFVLPLGATVNMDGTALYECVAALFIAQAYGVQLDLLQQGIVVVTALLASIGAAGIPMAGLVMMVVILRAVGLPLEGVGMILAVDRVLDMMRTAVNVWSDTCGAVCIARSEAEPLENIAR